jgi:hypothetical protein
MNRHNSSLQLYGQNLVQSSGKKRYPQQQRQLAPWEVAEQNRGASAEVAGPYAANLDQKTLQKVVRNMEAPKSLQFRNNTGNRGYGFVQKVENEVPAERLHKNSLNPDQGYVDYKYSVAGNHK